MPFLHLLADIAPLVEVREPFRDGQEPWEQKGEFSGNVLSNGKHYGRRHTPEEEEEALVPQVGQSRLKLDQCMEVGLCEALDQGVTLHRLLDSASGV